MACSVTQSVPVAVTPLESNGACSSTASAKFSIQGKCRLEWGGKFSSPAGFIGFAVSARMSDALHAAILEAPESGWKAYGKPQPDVDRECAEVVFVSKRGVGAERDETAALGECPTSRPERCKNLIEFRAIDCLVANCSEKASGHWAGALPFLRRFEHLLLCCAPSTNSSIGKGLPAVIPRRTEGGTPPRLAS